MLTPDIVSGRSGCPESRGPAAAVLLIHEWWGITQHVRDYTRELASKGYTALAVDMYGNGKTADNPKDAGALMGSVMTP